jgi:Glutaredoxin and related proteins
VVEMQYVPGDDHHKVVLYALSTCGWCARTKQLLTDLGVEFSYVYVDLLPAMNRAPW